MRVYPTKVVKLTRKNNGCVELYDTKGFCLGIFYNKGDVNPIIKKRHYEVIEEREV